MSRLSNCSNFSGSQQLFWFTFSGNNNDIKSNSCYDLSKVEIIKKHIKNTYKY